MSFSGILKEALVDAYDAIIDLIAINLLWVALTLLVVTAPPAAAGLYYATNCLAHTNRVSWQDFFVGFRQFFWLSWRWALTLIGVLAVLAGNLVFYLGFDEEWATFMRGFMLTLAFLWIALHIYTFPLLLEQEDRRVRVALRNSLVLILRNPGETLGLIIFLVILGALSTYLRIPWLFITLSLAGFLANRFTLHLLSRYKSEATGA